MKLGLCVYMCGHELDFVDKAKNLGFLLDGLTLEFQINGIVKAVNYYLHISKITSMRNLL